MEKKELELLEEEIKADLERDQKDEDLTDDDLIYHRMGYTFYLSN
jgi:hypothetical protein